MTRGNRTGTERGSFAEPALFLVVPLLELLRGTTERGETYTLVCSNSTLACIHEHCAHGPTCTVYAGFADLPYKYNIPVEAVSCRGLEGSDEERTLLEPAPDGDATGRYLEEECGTYYTEEN